MHALKKILHDKGISTAVGDEGGFAPNVPNHEAAIQMILEAIDKAGYVAGEQIALGLDCAADRLFGTGEFGDRMKEPVRRAVAMHVAQNARGTMAFRCWVNTLI